VLQGVEFGKAVKSPATLPASEFDLGLLTLPPFELELIG
jgi:hypothetical protein